MCTLLAESPEPIEDIDDTKDWDPMAEDYFSPKNTAALLEYMHSVATG